MRPVLVACLGILLGCGNNPSQPGAGSTAPTPGPAGAPAPDAGPPDAGPPATSGGDAGATPDAGSPGSGGGVVDAGTAADAGTTASECDGLAPEQVGAPNGRHTMQANRVDCSAAVNAYGVLALQMGNTLEPENSAVHFVGPDGTVRSQTPQGTHSFLLGRFSMFEGIGYSGGPGPGTLKWAPQSWDDHGNLVSMGPSRDGSAWVVEDPLGGMTVLVRGGAAAVENYDERGNLRWHVQLAPVLTAIGVFVVDRIGNTFVTADSAKFDKSVVAQWIDHDGNATPAFQLLGPQHEWNHLEGNAIVRVGSGLFVHADDWWQLESMSTQLAAPPAWFIAGQTFAMYMVRNGRAYGVISAPSGADCTATVEVVTASGKSCGKATFSAGPGGCYAASASIGYDGTFVQRVPPPDGVCSGGVCACTWHWWTGFFQ